MTFVMKVYQNFLENYPRQYCARISSSTKNYVTSTSVSIPPTYNTNNQTKKKYLASFGVTIKNRIDFINNYLRVFFPVSLSIGHHTIYVSEDHGGWSNKSREKRKVVLYKWLNECVRPRCRYKKRGCCWY